MSLFIAVVASVAGCGERGCVLRAWYDIECAQSMVQHGENPEALFILSDAEQVHMSHDEVEKRVVEWARRVHAYEAGESPEGWR